MRHKSVQWICLLAIVALAAVVRIYGLKDLPAGFFCDEAGLGYNAFAIASEGTDENGNSFPLFFWSFGTSYKNPAFIYAAAPLVKLLGLSEFSVRLTSALYGIGTVVALFFLGRALMGAWVGLFAAFFLAIAPWHVHFSRIAFELISFPFFFVIGFAFFVTWSRGRKTLPAAMFFFGLCFYAYAIANLFVPLFVVGATLLYLPSLLRRWRESLLAFIVLVATISPIGVLYFTRQDLTTQYFRNTTTLRPEEPLATQAERVWRFYQQFFSSEFLFERGDPIVRHAVPDFGELYPFYLPFLIVGVLVAAFRRDRCTKLVLWWLLLYPLGASLMTEIPSATRSFIGAPAFCLLTAMGFGAILWAIGRVLVWRPLALTAQAAGLIAAGYLLYPQVEAYARAYIEEYPKRSAPGIGGFQYGYRESIQYMETQRSNYDLLMLTAVDVNQPQIFPVFYRAMPPSQARANGNGYLIINPAEFARYSPNQRLLASVRPSDLDLFSHPEIHRKVVAPGGRVEFIIAELKDRKQFLTNWMILGLFDNEGGKGVSQEFIDVANLEKRGYQGVFGEAFWRRISPQFVEVDLNRFFAGSDKRSPGNPEHVCAYATVTANSDESKEAFLELSGTDDYIEIWLNGRALTPFPIMLSEKHKQRPIQLNRGRNVLVLKSCENVGLWSFRARITDAEGEDMKGVTTIPEIPEGPIPKVETPAERNIQLVEGFTEIVSFKQHEPAHHDYRGQAESWWVYVHHDGGEIAWRTAPPPEKKTTVFVFTISLSDEAGEAELYVGEEFALKFEMGNDRGLRTWSRGPYRLAFVSKAGISGNSGVMLLEVPANKITPGQPAELRVIPSGGRNEAWVAIKSYRDTIAHEGITAERANEALNNAWSETAGAE
jgi:4-amino-4-deoxy-L-arabinose transferase-like glycosyltransferase